MLVTKQLTVAIDFHSRGKNSMEVNLLVNNILQNIFFCVQPKKLIHTGLEKLEGEQMVTKILYFWVNWPF